MAAITSRPAWSCQASPEHEPDPVTDLTVDVADNGTRAVVATWTPPRHGDVRLTAADAPPRWAAGDRITLREATAPPRRGLPGYRGAAATAATGWSLPCHPGGTTSCP